MYEDKVREWLMQPGNNFCALPFSHMAIESNGDIRPCCMGDEFDLNIRNKTIQQVYNDPTRLQFVDSFRRNEKHQLCYQCWKDPEIRINMSSQPEAMEVSEQAMLGNMPEHKLKWLEIKPGNRCNLKCRICGGFSSSKWATEEIKQGSLNAKEWLKAGMWPRKTDSLWNEVVDMLPQIEHFEFTGGEPFMIQEHFDLLEKSVELGHAKQQEIHYNTNGTQFPEYAMKHIWPHFKHVEIAFSIDDIRTRFEYQRYGAKWDHVNENIVKFNELKADRKNISTQIFKAMLENSASEQGSRMSAMDNATRNAGEMVDKLTIEYNRSRQAAITKELIEIISGAESL